jgi:hypothetical protein
MTTETSEQGQETQLDPAVVDRAKQMGWVPKEQFRGDVSKWTDADVWVERGETVLPILRANNQRLENELGQTKGQITKLTELLSAATESIEALKEFNSAANLEQVKARKQQLLEGIKKAKEAENIDQEVELQDQLDETNAAIRAAKAIPKVKESPPSATPPAAQQIDPVYVQWASENSWFGKDLRKSGYANGIAQELRLSQPNLVGRPFLDAVAAEVDKHFRQNEPGESRVSGSRNGAGGSGSSNQGGKVKAFSSLPQDAQEACMRQAGRLVGAGRAYKTVEDWQSAYVKTYNDL